MASSISILILGLKTFLKLFLFAYVIYIFGQESRPFACLIELKGTKRGSNNYVDEKNKHWPTKPSLIETRLDRHI